MPDGALKLDLSPYEPIHMVINNRLASLMDLFNICDKQNLWTMSDPKQKSTGTQL